jgi:hypothetical protein
VSFRLFQPVFPGSSSESPAPVCRPCRNWPATKEGEPGPLPRATSQNRALARTRNSYTSSRVFPVAPTPLDHLFWPPTSARPESGSKDRPPKSLEAKAGFWTKDVAKWNGWGRLSGRFGPCSTVTKSGSTLLWHPGPPCRNLGQRWDKPATEASVARAFMARCGAQPIADGLD